MVQHLLEPFGPARPLVGVEGCKVVGLADAGTAVAVAVVAVAVVVVAVAVALALPLRLPPPIVQAYARPAAVFGVDADAATGIAGVGDVGSSVGAAAPLLLSKIRWTSSGTSHCVTLVTLWYQYCFPVSGHLLDRHLVPPFNEAVGEEPLPFGGD